MNQQIGPYRLVEHLGQGAFGSVFRALSPVGHEVAVKILLHESARAKARFAREIEAIRRLQHPGIVPLLDHGEERGRPYLVMRYVRGQTCESLGARERSLSPSRAAELLVEVARAIHFAHGEGVLHRDLKPANVLVDEQGAARVLDFGLASLQDADERLSLSGHALGTLAYMAPEQAVGRSAGPPTDVFGLGATLYFLLTGEGPLDRVDNPILALHRDEPPPPSSLRPEVGPVLDAICLKALARAPEQRFASAAELADALQDFLQGSDSGVFGRQSVPLALARRPRPLALFALALALAGGAGGAYYLSAQDAGPPDATPTTSSPAAGSAEAPWEAEFGADARPEDLLERVRASGRAEDADALEAFCEGLRLAQKRAPNHEVLALSRRVRGATSPALRARLSLDFGELALRRLQPTDALEILSQGRDRSPRRVLLQAWALRQDSRQEEAARLLSELLERDDLGAERPAIEAASLLHVRAPTPAITRALDALEASARPEDGLATLLCVQLAQLSSDLPRCLRIEESALRRSGAHRLGPDLGLMIGIGQAFFFAKSEETAERRLRSPAPPKLTDEVQAMTAPNHPPDLLLLAGFIALAQETGPEFQLARDLVARIDSMGKASPLSDALLYRCLEGLGRFEAAAGAIRQAHARHGLSLAAALRIVGGAPLTARARGILGLDPLSTLSPAQEEAIQGLAVQVDPRARPRALEVFRRWALGARWERLAPGFAAARALAPEDQALISLQAEALIERRRFSEAQAFLAERSPLSQEQELLRLEVLFRLNELRELLAQVSPLLERSDYVGALARAFAALGRRDHERAITICDQILTVLPTQRQARWIRLLALVEAGQHLRAAELAGVRFREVALLDLHSAQVYGQMLVFASRGQDRERLAQQGLRHLGGCEQAAPGNQALLFSLLRAIHSERFFAGWIPVSSPGWVYDLERCGADPQKLAVERGMSLLRRGAPREAVDKAWASIPSEALPPHYREIYKLKFEGAR